jgi:hypothetical protein
MGLMPDLAAFEMKKGYLKGAFDLRTPPLRIVPIVTRTRDIAGEYGGIRG